jgi:hypothetical protein
MPASSTLLAVDLGAGSGRVIAGRLSEGKLEFNEVHRFGSPPRMEDGFLRWDANHIETEICTYIERQFLRTLEGGCTAPIGAIATYNEEADRFNFTGVLLSIDGKQKLEIHKTVDVSQWKKLGYELAQEILAQGGTALMAEIKKSLQK